MPGVKCLTQGSDLVITEIAENKRVNTFQSMEVYWKKQPSWSLGVAGGVGGDISHSYIYISTDRGVSLSSFPKRCWHKLFERNVFPATSLPPFRLLLHCVMSRQKELTQFLMQDAYPPIPPLSPPKKCERNNKNSHVGRWKERKELWKHDHAKILHHTSIFCAAISWSKVSAPLSSLTPHTTTTTFSYLFYFVGSFF